MDHRPKAAAGLRGLALLCAVAVLVTAATPANRPGSGQDKVDRFLNLIMKARSLEEINRAYERGAFSAAEAKRIAAEVAKPAYKSKLASLKPKLPPMQVNKLEETKTARPAPASTAKTKPLPKAKATPAKLADAPAISPQELQAITSRPGGGTEARISQVSPSRARAGRDLAIVGSGFGRRRGSVEILLDGRRYVCDLESWGDAAIRAVVPEYMASVIGDRARDALLWVKPAGGPLGPTAELRLEPEPDPVKLPTSRPGEVAQMVDVEISTYVELDGSSSLADTETFEILVGSRLANGWRIVSSRLEKVRGSGTCEYIREPRAGTSDLYQVIRLNTSAFSVLRVASRMVIRGPKGTDYL